MIRACSSRLLMFVFLCLCSCQCCPPRAFPVPTLQHVEVFVFTYLLLALAFLLTYYAILTIGNALSSMIRFIPFNVNLNLLTKCRCKKNLTKPIELVYSFFTVAMFLEESASVVYFVLDTLLLDVICYDSLLLVIKVNLMLFQISTQSAMFIVLHHKIIFQPIFCNFELTAFWIFSLVIMMSSDVHPNPGPAITNQNFHSGFLSFCNWNLNTLSKDNFYRISLLEAHNTLFKYDIISLCETSLSDEITVPENALPGYMYHPLNNPSGERNGGVGIFYKESLP